MRLSGNPERRLELRLERRLEGPNPDRDMLECMLEVSVSSDSVVNAIWEVSPVKATLTIQSAATINPSSRRVWMVASTSLTATTTAKHTLPTLWVLVVVIME